MRFPAGPPPSYLWLLLLLLPAGGALFGAYVMVAPTTLRYSVDAEALVVEAHVGRMDDGVRVPRAELRGVESRQVTGAHRRNGTAMGGYCAGDWAVDGVGEVALATDCRADVLVISRASGPPLVISPPDALAFQAALQDPQGAASGSLPGRTVPVWAYALAALVIALPVGLALLLRQIFRPLVYRIEGGSLFVPRHFGELEVPLAGVRLRRADLGRAFRLAGTGLPGLWLGAFRDGEGGFHASASRREGGLMIHARRRVFVTPIDIERFIEAAGAQGAREA